MKFQIKEAREKAGYSQRELAEIIGVAPNTFHGYESGKHDPRSVLLIEIAKACDVSVDFLLGLSDKPNSNLAPSATIYSDITALLDKLTPEQVGEAKGYIKRMLEEDPKKGIADAENVEPQKRIG